MERAGDWGQKENPQPQPGVKSPQVAVGLGVDVCRFYHNRWFFGVPGVFDPLRRLEEGLLGVTFVGTTVVAVAFWGFFGDQASCEEWLYTWTPQQVVFGNHHLLKNHQKPPVGGCWYVALYLVWGFLISFRAGSHEMVSLGSKTNAKPIGTTCRSLLGPFSLYLANLKEVSQLTLLNHFQTSNNLVFGFLRITIFTSLLADCRRSVFFSVKATPVSTTTAKASRVKEIWKKSTAIPPKKYQDPQRYAFWLAFRHIKPTKKHGTFGGPGMFIRF